MFDLEFKKNLPPGEVGKKSQSAKFGSLFYFFFSARKDFFFRGIKKR